MSRGTTHTHTRDICTDIHASYAPISVAPAGLKKEEDKRRKANAIKDKDKDSPDTPAKKPAASAALELPDEPEQPSSSASMGSRGGDTPSPMVMGLVQCPPDVIARQADEANTPQGGNQNDLDEDAAKKNKRKKKKKK